jgi:hypothetical protein
MHEYVSAIREFRGNVPVVKLRAMAGCLTGSAPSIWKPWTPWNGGHTEATASQERRLECGLELARLTTAPLPWKSGRLCARASTPNGPQSSALSLRLLADYEEGLVVVKPGDTEGPASRTVTKRSS